MTLRALTLCLFAGVAGCAAPGPNAPASAGMGSEVAALSSLPTPLGGVYERRGPTVPDRTPGVVSGAMLPLAAPDSFATVYLFRRTPAPVADGVASREAGDELAMSTAAMISRVSAETGTRGAGPLGVAHQVEGVERMRCSAVAVPVANGMRGDAVCVGGVAGSLLKLRTTTFLRGAKSGGDPAAATLATAIAALALAQDVQSRLGGVAPGLRT